MKFPPSDTELEDAYNIYEDQLEGLGNEFLDDFNKTIKLLLDSTPSQVVLGTELTYKAQL